jgi:ribosomal protein L31
VDDTDGTSHVLAVPKDTRPQSQPPQTCAREAHALWACRAVTLACASDLGQLKSCFDSTTTIDILSQSHTAYEKTTRTNLPCQTQQERMGLCVAKKAAELQVRVAARQRAQTEDE